MVLLSIEPNARKGTDVEQDLEPVVGMSLRKAIGLYLACLGLTLLLIRLEGDHWIPGGPALLVYFGSGLLLNRVVLRGLIAWHPMHDTLHNVASAKLRAFLFWPLQYAVLFFQLSVDRVL